MTEAAPFIYVIGPSGGPFKIGYARNPQTRLREIQTGHPHRLQVFHAVEHKLASVFETRVHSALRERRLMGEWFDVTLECAIETVDGIVYADEKEERDKIERNFAHALSMHIERENSAIAMIDLIAPSLTLLDASTKNPRIIASGQRLIRKWRLQANQRALCLWWQD